MDAAASQPEYRRAVFEMAQLMGRRGPDDQGFWEDPGGHLQLGFRRLAILDLSDAGHQPMVSENDRGVLVFNGEIYNWRELRAELEAQGIRFRSRSDSEVLLEALTLWNRAALERLNGMFAFAYYDREEERLLLARDHAGIKPLYYSRHPATGAVSFASQFNALLRTPALPELSLRHDVLRLYLQLHHIPPPLGLFEHTFQLEPGHFLEVRSDGKSTHGSWWGLPQHQGEVSVNEGEIDRVRESITGAVRRQLVADVPVGVFLSGGIDSTLVSAYARDGRCERLQAFTIGSPGWAQDEAATAASYAQTLGLDHVIENTTDSDLDGVVSDVVGAQHEPFADFSILPTLMVSRLARDRVTVCLSGDGGDELFFGYERPLSLLRNGRDFRWPRPVRLALYASGRYGPFEERSDVITHRSPAEYYLQVNSRLQSPALERLSPALAAEPLPLELEIYDFAGYEDERNLAVYARKAEYYGQMQRCLKKVDMASMFHSLEVRVPLLDREVIDASLAIDPLRHVAGGTRKQLLRSLLEEHIPRESIPTAKRGFAVPLGEWLKGPLRERAEATLLGRDLFPGGLFETNEIKRYWHDHLAGRSNDKWGLWTLLSLQWWADEHLPNGTARS